ncbi:MAG: hypothetical protein KF736_02055 [Acidobacteria bacterium]|nr:hypothetical protein [Acidobacteriota bacterium]MCW5949191.1 hypothetical protein [Pyrinomonadaceae bacterium]
MSGDLAGAIFLVLLAAGGYFGLKALSKPVERTTEDFERKAAEGTTMMGASMNALHEMLNPEAARGQEVQTQMKEGRYGKKRREGKANDDGTEY